jgi:hypothetical protein
MSPSCSCRSAIRRLCCAAASARDGAVVLQRLQRVGGVLESAHHGGLVLRLCLVVGRLGGALPVQQRAALEDRLNQRGGDAPEGGLVAEGDAEVQRGAAGRGLDVDVRQSRGYGHADRGAGRVQLRLGHPHVRPLRDQPRWRADRQRPGQREVRKLEGRARALGRRAAEQRRQQVAVGLELLVQWRQRRLRLRQQRLLGGEVRRGGLAKVELPAQRCQDPLLVGDDEIGRVDLGPERGVLHGGGHHAVGQGDARGRQLEPLRLFERDQVFHLSAVRAKDVGRVRDRYLRGGQRIERVAGLGRAGQRLGEMLAARCDGALHAWEVIALLGEHGLVRRLQRSAGGCDRPVVLQRLGDQLVERRTVERAPPLGGRVAAKLELRSAWFGGCRAGGAVAGSRRQRRTVVVRADRAGGKAERGQSRYREGARH